MPTVKQALCVLFVLAVSLSCAAQFEIPLSGRAPSSGEKKNSKVTSRTLTGTVLDKSDKPLSSAVVYLKNKKTLAVKTYIAQKDGAYRFPELSLNVDYEVYAQKDGKKSDTKTLSAFDDRPAANINLRIDTRK